MLPIRRRDSAESQAAFVLSPFLDLSLVWNTPHGLPSNDPALCQDFSTASRRQEGYQAVMQCGSMAIVGFLVDALGLASRLAPAPDQKLTTPTLLTLLTLLNPLTLITSSIDHRRHCSSSCITSSFIVASPLYTYCVTLHKDEIDNVEQSGTFPSASSLS